MKTPDTQGAPQTPWACRWAYVAGAVRRSRTVDAAGVLWTCGLREQSEAPLFTGDECRCCQRWFQRQGRVSADWTSGPAGSATSTSPIRHVRVPRGAAIIKEGAAADTLYTILSGSAKLLKMTSSGRAIGIDVCAPGRPLGAELVLQGSSFATTAVAIEATTCAAAPRRLVVGLLNDRPHLVRGLIAETSELERNLVNRIEVAGAHVEARLAHLFLWLARKVGAPENGTVVIGIPLQRQDLAELTGTTVETSIRVMSRWDRHGIVEAHEKGGFVIRNVVALERLRRG